MDSYLVQFQGLGKANRSLGKGKPRIHWLGTTETHLGAGTEKPNLGSLVVPLLKRWSILANYLVILEGVIISGGNH